MHTPAISTCRRVDIVDYMLRHWPFIDHRELYKEKKQDRERGGGGGDAAHNFVCVLSSRVVLFLI